MGVKAVADPGFSWGRRNQPRAAQPYHLPKFLKNAIKLKTDLPMKRKVCHHNEYRDKLTIQGKDYLILPVLARFCILHQIINTKYVSSRNPLQDLSDLPDLTEMRIVKNSKDLPQSR